MSKHSDKTMLSTIIRAFLAFAILMALAQGAAAASLDELRASGALGERFDGFVVARDASAGADAKAINAKRREIYQKRADSEGVDIDAVGRLYAKQILSDAPAGTWFLKDDGTWVQK